MLRFMATRFALSTSFVLLLARISEASFSLNDSGPDWDYTDQNLKSTTSEKCQQAYSAQVDCTDTLVGIVASMRPAFDPDATDLDVMCTSGCQSALQQYVDNVKAACSLPNDAAEVLVNATKPYVYADAPVQLVGQMFQYSYAQACRKADNGSYCYLTHSAFADTDFDCDDTCYTSFYQNAHDYPASAYWFNYYSLLPQSQYWDQTFQEGYEHLESCGNANSSASSSSSPTTSGAAFPCDTSSDMWGWATNETGRASLFSDLPSCTTASTTAANSVAGRSTTNTAATASATSNGAMQSRNQSPGIVGGLVYNACLAVLVLLAIF